jgi:hypothetical protein
MQCREPKLTFSGSSVVGWASAHHSHTEAYPQMTQISADENAFLIWAYLRHLRMIGFCEGAA